MTIKKYRPLRVVTEAVQFTGENRREVIEWLGRNYCGGGDVIRFHTSADNDATARRGDWIVKGVKGNFTVIPYDIFAATYEPAS